ncbi:ion transporter, partial [bacterium]|nr:ion transporter [bacterium]
MISPDFTKAIGIAGVSRYESVRAKFLGKCFEWPMIFIAVWIPIRWYTEHIQVISPFLAASADWAVWLLFFCETLVVGLAVNDKGRYFRQNWLNIAIIICGFPLLWHNALLAGSLRVLRIVVSIGVFLRLARASQKFLKKNQLGATLMVSFVVIVLFGIVISLIDPSIRTAEEG